MKKSYVFIFLLFFIFSCEAKKYQATGKTVLGNGQIPFSSLTPEMVSNFRIERTYARKGINGGTIQGVLFGGKSTHATANGLARYFFPHHKTHLSVVEDDQLDNFEKKKDLLAQQFNIFTKNGDFRSEISIAPSQSVVGLGVYWRHCLLRDPFKGNDLWVSVSTALENIRNRMNLQEMVINNGDGPDESAGVPVVANMKQALKQLPWLFGKITDNTLSKTGLADIELKFGYDNFLWDEPSHMELYIGIVIPTGNKYNGKFVFEPIVGRGKYAGLMSGGAFGKILGSNYTETKKLLWELAVHGEYLFKNKQKRSLDLVDKPWTRYIQLYANQEQAQEAADLILIDRSRAINLATPGINVLTRLVTVSPGFLFDMNGAFIVEYDDVRIEFGYNLFFRRAEDIKLSHHFDPVFAIKHADGVGTTNPIHDITGNKYLEQNVVDSDGNLLIPVALADFKQSIIQKKDLDFLSATTPALFSHTIYASAGVCFDERTYPLMIASGVSYTFADNNAVINKWLLWLKSGISF
jgi:hypothetical protein